MVQYLREVGPRNVSRRVHGRVDAVVLESFQALGDVVERADLLGYHTLGMGKYLRLGLEYALLSVPELGYRLIERTMDLGTDLGLNMCY